MEDYIVKATGLYKQYGSFRALEGVDLYLPTGEIIGLLGPNGSGKTTLIKILAGLLTPTGGEVRIGGYAPGVESKAMVSYLPERPYFNSWMRVDECLTFFSNFYADFDRAFAVAMLQDLGVDITAKLKTLSKGTKEKVQLVLVMARRAALYLLDEPIAGVDPAARDYVLRTVLAARREDATILISTHLIADVENMLDGFLFLQRGRILLSGNTADVRAEQGMSLDAYFREVFRC